MNKKRTKKNTKKHLYEIKNYEFIREFIRALLFSPGMNETTMQNDGIINSRRTFYERLKNITFYLNKDKINKIIKKYRINDTTYQTILNDLYDFPTNYFTDTYVYSSYKEADLYYYIRFMQKISEYLDNDDSKFVGKDIIEEVSKALKVKVKKEKFLELEKLGIIEKVNNKDNKYTYYQLTEDIFKHGNSNFLDNLQDMVIFFYNHHFLSIPGYFLSKTIEQYKIFTGKTDINDMCQPENNIFAYRYVPKYNTIDNNILWNILEAIKHKQIIQYSYISQDNTIIKCQMVPIKVVIEYEYGKQYCYGYDHTKNEYFLSRIDMMSNLKITKETYINKEIYLNFDKDFRNRWMVANNEGSYNVKVFFNFPKEKKKVLKRNLENTMRFGAITENGDQIIFNAAISNYKEIIPWINSFGEYAVVDKDTCPELYEQIKTHNDKLRELYGII